MLSKVKKSLVSKDREKNKTLEIVLRITLLRGELDITHTIPQKIVKSITKLIAKEATGSIIYHLTKRNQDGAQSRVSSFWLGQDPSLSP